LINDVLTTVEAWSVMDWIAFGTGIANAVGKLITQKELKRNEAKLDEILALLKELKDKGKDGSEDRPYTGCGGI
jgi:hypothetical protein